MIHPSEFIVDLKNIHKSFKGLKAVEGVDLSIQKGEFLGLLGPNGAGKTTLIEIVEGLQKPDLGTVKILNKTWDKDEHALRHAIGISLQETKFMDKLSVWETLKMFAVFYEIKEQRIEEVLELINLSSKRKSYTVNLSGGQKQRLALGIALLHKPPLLLLDEPTTGLDPTARRELWNILENLRRDENTSMILTTHYMEEAEFLCNRIVIMDKGKFIAEGNVEELISKYSEGEIIEFSLSSPLETEPKHFINGVKNTFWDIPLLRGKMTVENISKSLPMFIQYLTDHQIQIVELECRKTTLDDLFIAMTGRSIHEN